MFCLFSFLMRSLTHLDVEFLPSQGSICGSSCGFEEFVKLNSCDDDISAHLSKCQLSHEVVSERELILARSGFFELDEIQTNEMIVYPKHWHLLGKYLRPSKSCQHPSHSGSKSTIIGTHVFNFKLTCKVMTIFGITVPIEARKYM